jgi:hypothetical protein
MIDEEKWSIFAPSPSAMKEARSIIDELLEDKPVRVGNKHSPRKTKFIHSISCRNQNRCWSMVRFTKVALLN